MTLTQQQKRIDADADRLAARVRAALLEQSPGGKGRRKPDTLTRVGIARAAGIHAVTLAKFAAGQRDLGVVTLERLAQALKVK